MQCPIDQTTLQMTTRQGIEIDYCPQCRGVWLDRGELDKLIEREQGGSRQPEPQQRYEDYRRHDNSERPHYDEDRRKPHKKESFLGDLFDF